MSVFEEGENMKEFTGPEVPLQGNLWYSIDDMIRLLEQSKEKFGARSKICFVGSNNGCCWPKASNKRKASRI